MTRVVRRRPPHDPTSASSTEAAEAKEPTVEVDRLRVLDLLEAVGPIGATCDEAEEVLALAHQNASARFRELEKAGEILRSPRFRPTRLGRAAQVYVWMGLLCPADRALLRETTE